MSNTPTILGISMAPQKNRRLFVAVAYAIVGAYIAVLVIMPSWVHELGPVGRQFFGIAGVGFVLALSWYWFLNLTNVTPLGRRLVSVEITRLGLTPGPRDSYGPDEREVAIRNAAFHKAYRVVVYFSIVPVVALDQLRDHLNSSNAWRLANGLVLILFVIMWTLPQAIIVWTEPDMAEEEKA